MTNLEFQTLCGKYLIDINIALENEELRELLKTRASYQTIENFLKEEF